MRPLRDVQRKRSRDASQSLAAATREDDVDPWLLLQECHQPCNVPPIMGGDVEQDRLPLTRHDHVLGRRIRLDACRDQRVHDVHAAGVLGEAVIRRDDDVEAPGRRQRLHRG